jgi:galactokinase
MDQAASVISDPSSALYISFYPALAAFPVPLPPKAIFVCANSLVISDKAVTAKHRYNLRVVETLVGARILAKELGIPITDTERITFREVIGRFAGEEDETSELSIEELQEALEIVITKLDVLKPQQRDGVERLGLTMEEMISMSGLAQPVFVKVYLSWVDIEATHFQLYNRAKHVLSESLRVLQFRKICLDAFTCPATGSAGSVAVLESLGNLMNDSQRSCSSLFDCSCPELDTLVSLSIQAGAFGSRLTGAGWGGCTVSLVAEDKVEEFIEKVSKTYEPYRGLEGEELNQVIFATKPSSGACGTSNSVSCGYGTDVFCSVQVSLI